MHVNIAVYLIKAGISSFIYELYHNISQNSIKAPKISHTVLLYTQRKKGGSTYVESYQKRLELGYEFLVYLRSNKKRVAKLQPAFTLLIKVAY